MQWNIKTGHSVISNAIKDNISNDTNGKLWEDVANKNANVSYVDTNDWNKSGGIARFTVDTDETTSFNNLKKWLHNLGLEGEIHHHSCTHDEVYVKPCTKDDLRKIQWCVEKYTATEGQTVINLSNTLATDDENAIKLFIDGIELSSSDYTVSSADNNITLVDALTGGEKIKVVFKKVV